MRIVLLACLLPLVAVTACRGEPEASTAGAAATDGYRPDSMAWFRDGLPVRHDGRAWQPVGRPVHEPAESFRRVGEFEGMALYAAKKETPPHAHLFFPYGNDTWQTLAPVADSAASEPDSVAPGS